MDKEASGLLVVAHGLSHDLQTPLRQLRRRLDDLRTLAEEPNSGLHGAETEIGALVRDVETIDRLLRDLTLTIRQQDASQASASLGVAEVQIIEILNRLHHASDELRVRYQVNDLQANSTNNNLVMVVVRALRLRNKVAALLRLGKEVTTFKPKVLPFRKVIDRALNEYRSAVVAAKGEVSIERLPSLEVDSEQFVALIGNLFSNAIKYRSPKRKLKISISYESASRHSIEQRYGVLLRGPKDKSYAVIQVSDNGIGIGKEDHIRIFDLFVRVEPSEAITQSEIEPASSGEGIGLAICRQIAKSHGGDIFVSSSPGKGSTFNVAIPKTVTVERGAKLEFIDSDEILIIEDDPEIIELYVAVSKRLNLTIKVLRGEKDFRKYSAHWKKVDARKFVPRMIFLDLYLERGTGGINILRDIRRGSAAARATPVVVVSSSSDPLEIYRCYREGANAYLSKDISAKRLEDAITQSMSYWTDLVSLPQVFRSSGRAL